MSDTNKEQISNNQADYDLKTEVKLNTKTIFVVIAVLIICGWYFYSVNKAQAQRLANAENQIKELRNNNNQLLFLDIYGIYTEIKEDPKLDENCKEFVFNKITEDYGSRIILPIQSLAIKTSNQSKLIIDHKKYLAKCRELSASVEDEMTN